MTERRWANPPAGRWPTVIAAVAVLAITFSLVYWLVTEATRNDDLVKAGAAERRAHAAEVAELRRDIRELRVIVEWFEENGATLPPPSVLAAARRGDSVTIRTERDSDDDDSEDRDMVVVNPPASAPSSDSDDGDEPESPGRITDDLPDVPLPDAAGQATDDVKDIADDALDGLVPLIP